MKAMKIIRALFFFLLPLSGFCQDTTQYVIEGRRNSAEQMNKPYVMFISLDGLRYDLTDRYEARFLNKKRKEGVQAESMKPSFPTLTFPNHYTLATGLFPAQHGLVGNSFYAGKNSDRLYTMGNRDAVRNADFYGGIPIWSLAEDQQMISASFFWVGSEAPIKKLHPTYYFNYSEVFGLERRIDIVREWLLLPEESRPHLITFYMPEVDHKLHRYGTVSDSVRMAVQYVDRAIRRLNEMTDSLNIPMNFIVVSDHGMIDVDTANPIRRPEALDTSKFRIAFSSSVVNVYAKDKQDKKLIQQTYQILKKEAQGYSVYLSSNAPRRWNFRKSDDRYGRLGEILLVADGGKAFSFSRRAPSPGEHGYDNELPEMQASFYAWGPAFKTGQVIPSFSNVHVYPLIAHLLGLKISHRIDGDLKVLQGILKDQ